MKEKDFLGKEQNTVQNGKDGKKNLTRFYAALLSVALAATALGLAFLPAAGIYFLTASVILEICALSFSGSQKKIYSFAALKILRITAYILLILSGALFLGGIVYSFLV